MTDTDDEVKRLYESARRNYQKAEKYSTIAMYLQCFAALVWCLVVWLR